MKFVSVVLCLVLAYANADIGIGPRNQWVYLNSTTPVRLTCSTTAASIDTASIQWWEYGTNPNGALVSDQDQLINSHPNRIRYSLETAGPGQHDLLILEPTFGDGTFYMCIDIRAVPGVGTPQLGAQLVVIERDPVCTTTLNSTTIIEGARYTMECIMHYNSTPGSDPRMFWTGPEPYIPAIVIGNNSIWSGIQFVAERSMQSGAFTCKTNFTQTGFIGPADVDSTIPNYDNQQRSPQLIINWPPKNMRYDPQQTSYNVGTTLVGFADALPAATYYWLGMWGPAEGKVWNTISFQIDSSLVGNNTFRFHAQNTINGQLYVNDIFPNIYVNVIPTTPTAGPSTTTTLAPPRANCNDLTGKWVSTSPPAILCFSVDYTTNGVISGTFKNGSDTYAATIYGRIQLNTFDQGGFTAINGQGKGVFSFVLECQACFGVETMIVSTIQNSATSIATCGSTGTSNVIPDYTFFRESNRPVNCF